MKTIGIVGANGQVGSEVSLFLSQIPGVRVIPISRNKVGAAFLRYCGLECRIGDINSPIEAPRLLEGCDLVADFTLPTGASSEVRAAMRSVISSVTRNAPGGVPYVYLSSITAFGFPDFRAPLRHYRLSQNTYGTLKRFAESLADRHGRQTGRPTYIYRVGVVHGELQAVSRKTLDEVRNSEGTTVYVPDAPSYTVFAYSIAEALVSAAFQKERPGVYTLLSNPAWSWEDLYLYYARRAGITPAVIVLSRSEVESKDSPGLLRKAVRTISGPVVRWAISRRSLLGPYVAAKLPEFESKVRAAYLRRNAALEVGSTALDTRWKPFGMNFDCLPGSRLSSLTDSRHAMQEACVGLARILAGAKAGQGTFSEASN